MSARQKSPKVLLCPWDETGEVTSCPGSKGRSQARNKARSKETSKASIRLEERSAAARSLGAPTPRIHRYLGAAGLHHRAPMGPPLAKATQNLPKKYAWVPRAFQQPNRWQGFLPRSTHPADGPLKLVSMQDGRPHMQGPRCESLPRSLSSKRLRATLTPTAASSLETSFPGRTDQFRGSRHKTVHTACQNEPRDPLGQS